MPWQLCLAPFARYQLALALLLQLASGNLEPHKDESPILLTGSGHSGTTLVTRLVGSHPNIYAMPIETEFLIPAQSGRRDNLVKMFRKRMAKSNSSRWAEKSPPHICHLHTAFQLFPKAKVLIVLRDGRDMVYSIELRFDSGDAVAIKAYSPDPIEAAVDLWQRSFNCMSPYLDDPRVRVVRYEDIIRAPEATLQSIFTFLGEPTNDTAILSSYKEASTGSYGNFALRKEQVAKPLFDGTQQWKKWTCEKRKQLEEEHPSFVSLLHGLGYGSLICAGDGQN